MCAMNSVNLTGNLTKNPELTYTPGGVAVTKLTIAVDRKFSNPHTGKKDADFIPIIAWRELGETAANYLQKGRLIGVTGRIQVRSYDGSDKKKVYVTEIIAEEINFLDSPPGNDIHSNNGGNSGNRSNNGDRGHSNNSNPSSSNGSSSENGSSVNQKMPWEE